VKESFAMNDKAFREHILNLLNSGDAHQNFDSEVESMPAEIRGKRPAGGHSPWELLEHMRIAQSDILRYSRGDADYVAAEFPQGYWPASAEPPSNAAWDESVAKFRADRDAFAAIVNDESVDLFAKIPRGNATMLAQVLLAADHNIYHLGQLVLARKILTSE
jgi:hypothetical protein